MSSGMMSSKRIAEKTGKEHKNVIRDIRAMLEALNKEASPNLGSDDGSNLSHQFSVKSDARGYDSEILLNERLCLCLASGYSITLRMMIIDDWAEMKKMQLPAIPQTFAAALRQLAAEVEAREIAEKEKEVIQLQLEEAKPKAEYADTVLDTSSELTTTVIANELGMSAVKLNAKLKEFGVQYKQGKTWVLKSAYHALGYTKLRTHVRMDNNGHTTTDHLLVWTEKGRMFIHDIIAGR